MAKSMPSESLKKVEQLPAIAAVADTRCENTGNTIDAASHILRFDIQTADAVVPAFPISAPRRLLKDCIDRGLACLILVVTSPLMLLLAVGVKLSSPGPVIFRQLRHGWDDQPIEVWKFRSMHLHEEADGAITQAVRGDNRVTPFGAFLRRTSLDELPQFLNVVQGRMSIVGPRPHAVAHNRFYKDIIPNYLLRHRVKPGITGWAQVNGLRGETATVDKMRQRVEHDLYYIQNWSLLLDARIMLRTIGTALFDKNAY